MVRLHEIFAGAPPHAKGTGGEIEECAYLEMEWVEGPTLAQLVNRTRASAETLRQRMTHVAEVGEALTVLLSHSRSAGNPSLHRDVKPSNCIVHSERGAVLIDISNLRLVDSGFDPVPMYTPAYAAPEVLRSPHQPRDASSDVYSLGALAAFCLLGLSPPAADDPEGRRTLGPRLVAAAGAARAADPKRLASLVMAALDADPSRRPADIITWGGQLVRASHQARDRRQVLRRGAVVLSVSAVAALAAVVFPTLPFRPSAAGELSTAGPQPTTVGRMSVGAGPPMPSGTGSPTTSPTGPLPSGRPDATSPSSTLRSPAPTTPTKIAVSTPPAPPTPKLASGRISSPATLSSVKQCMIMSGTAQLPTGTTLLIAMKNLDNGDPARYVERVFGWRFPEARWSWRGAQYFGTGDASVGQHYQVELMAIDLGVAQAADTPAKVSALAQRGTLLDTIELTRVAGSGPGDCLGP